MIYHDVPADLVIAGNPPSMLDVMGMACAGVAEILFNEKGVP